jgi:hypothetical protein
MFSPEFFIDTIQSTKKSIFDRIVSDPELRKVSDRYISTQTEFAKMMVANAIDLARYFLNGNCSANKENAEAPYKVDSPTEKSAYTDINTQGEKNV